MKKILILALLATTVSFAQRGPKHEDGNKEKQRLTAEQSATLQSKKMALALDLSKAQQGQVYDLKLTEAKARIAMHEKRKALKEGNEERVKPTAEERYKRENERLDAQIAKKAKMKSILSAEQYAKWEKMSHQRKNRGKKGGKKNGKGKEKKEMRKKE